MKYKYSQRINYIRFLLDVSCENCTHMAVVAEKNLSKVCYVQRHCGSGFGLHYGSYHGVCDSEGIYED